ncbi:filamentous hemagglutinin N-terminal domain-containing protein [Pleurocapsa sp. PCC 7319]|uniref:two-partner secretion domain-containing protein n=1 Tax=Pleurocapsa sp. PCC 7319 TaxID=118161 RepID=UPI0003483EC1|nr:filamentous hemagglutinin N-terminal domain-containing protein [Pleurocapsa sp. PCC 7319]
MKKRLSLLLFLVGCIIIPGILLKPATAQVTPDGTTNTTVNAEGNDFTIQDGNRSGNNLFHSFQDFSVPNGGSAFFDNAPDIANILSRVTGGNISNIDGLIRANGSANLFLINPAGIIFRQGARLDVGGSFYGSSASSILFEDGEFSATDLETPPLLTINAPIGLGFRSEPGEITNRSSVQNDSGEFVGLEVASGNNLAFIGGNINFEEGEATTQGGNIELGGLSEAGTVGINPDGSLSFPDGVTKADIDLSNGADVDARGTGGGSVSVNARNLNLSAGEEFGSSLIRAGIRAESTSAEAQAGDVTIDVAENITLDDSGIFNQVDSDGVGNSGNITINTGSIEAINGGDVDASTFGQGDAGSVNITATGDITFDGEDSGGTPSGATSNVNSDAEVNAGGVTISTANLTLTNGGQVAADTFGEGNAGSVDITASDTITIDGQLSDGGFPSNVTSLVNSDAVGDAGGVTISTANLTLTAGGQVNTSTLGDGNAGDVTIATDNLTLTSGGQVNTSTLGQGNGGNVEISAQDTIYIDGDTSFVASIVDEDVVGDAGDVSISAANLELSAAGFITTLTAGAGNAGDVTINVANLELSAGGFIATTTGGAGDAGDLTVNATESIFINGLNAEGDISSGLYANALLNDGNGGNVNVITNQLTINDGGTIDVGNFDNLVVTSQLTVDDSGTIDVGNLDDSNASPPGTGEPGTINIEANSINLSNRASIVAATQAETTSNSVNINLQVADSITLEDNSLISAQAFKNANGGNLTIDTNFIVAFPNGNNDIIATAEDGNGGNIDITAESLLGIEERPLNSNTNDINVSSEFGLDGNISIFTPDINTIQTDLELPNNLVDSQQTVAQACQSDRISGKSSGLTIQGKGGIPPQPTEPIDSEAILVQGKITTSKPPVQAPDIPPLGSNMGNILPARGIIKTEDGQIILTAYSTDQLDTRTPHISPNCR